MAEIGITSSISIISSLAGSLTVSYPDYGNSAAKKWYDMIVRKGVDATIRTYPLITFDPNTNKTTLGDARDFSAKVIPPYRNREGFKPAELITSGKGLTGIANYQRNFNIKAGLEIIISDKKWTVIGYTEVKDSTGILVYLLEIESGN